MKRSKIVGITLICALVLTFTGCSGSDGDTAPEVLSGGETKTAAEGGQAEGAGEASASTYHLVYRNVDLIPGAEADPAITSLGDDYSYFESPSCAYQGMDKVYTYDSVIIRTYTLDETDYINSIEIKDDTVETPEGIYIGCTSDQVTAAYGDPGSDSLIYVDGDVQVSFITDQAGTVTGISYDVVSE
ncbi:MAG: hypothetical protein IKT14_01655 [Clostridiales bacterium]|nr:hypothetical protein [Clostridiales bacterium]